MEFLSLQEPIEQPSLKMGRGEAILASVGLHLLLLLLFLFGPGVADRLLPESVLVLLRPRPAPVRPESAPGDVASSSKKADDASKIPLKFTYVSVPNDRSTEKNPEASLFSDKNRRARQEMATPRTARLFSRDPHSEGTSIERVKPDPTRPEGREDIEPEARPAAGSPDAGGTGRRDAAIARNRSRESASRPEGLLPGGRRSEPGASGGSGAETGAEAPGDRGVPAGAGDRGADPRESLKDALSNLKSGEYKFQFNNPAYLRDGSYGTLSFDTQRFPWGDYARRIYLVIRNNWFERIPLAAREGIRGWVCQHFVIEKEGAISTIRTLRPSGVPPFDKASADALAASSPLPPLPEDFPNPSEGVTFCFYYNMYPGEEGE